LHNYLPVTSHKRALSDGPDSRGKANPPVPASSPELLRQATARSQVSQPAVFLVLRHSTVLMVLNGSNHPAEARRSSASRCTASF